jgi:hypothetical protein
LAAIMKMPPKNLLPYLFRAGRRPKQARETLGLEHARRFVDEIIQHSVPTW